LNDKNMNPRTRNILAAIAGIIIGNLVNGGLISISGAVIPLPPSVDGTDLELKHFIFPFLAHALGTLVSAFAAASLAASHRMKFAVGMGILFLIGGIAASFMIPAPTWFIAVDLIGAYIPMGWLGGKLAEMKIRK
jgi:hypothetical protein